MNHRAAFTLIELLIVVAIIAILAAIALPNFLAAQVRAKVAEVKADQRAIATALESYFTDHDSYPPVSAQDARSDRPGRGYTLLTSPIAYITSWEQTFIDIFFTGETHGVTNQLRLDRFYEIAYADARGSAPSAPSAGSYKRTDRYLIEGLGPDGIDSIYSSESYPNRPSLFLSYDPSNGIISTGDIWRVGGAEVPSWLRGQFMSP
jgi:prepilin-type N-terminal cleavage/methylation domain-containing protein